MGTHPLLPVEEVWLLAEMSRRRWGRAAPALPNCDDTASEKEVARMREVVLAVRWKASACKPARLVADKAFAKITDAQCLPGLPRMLQSTI